MAQIAKTLPFVLIVGAALVLRLPYWTVSHLSWDESMYIAVGQELLEGHLPSTTYFVLKPPMAFVMYAASLGLLGNNVVAIRIGGFLCVAISGMIVFHLLSSRTERVAGMLGGILLVVFTSILPEVKATMTEHFAVLFTCLALLAFAEFPLTLVRAFLGGLCLALMVLTRTNLAYSALFIFCCLAILCFRRDGKAAVAPLATTAVGGIVPVLGFILAYYVDGSINVLSTYMIQGPLSVVHSQTSLTWNELAVVGQCFTFVGKDTWLLVTSFLLGSVIALRHHYPRFGFLAPIVLMGFAGTLFSILKTGKFYGHYYAQLVPYMAIMAGIALAWIGGRSRVVLAILLVVGVVLPCGAVRDRYETILHDAMHGKPLLNDTGYQIARYLNSKEVAGEYVYFRHYQIAQSLTRSKCPSQFMFPRVLHERQLLKQVCGEYHTPEKELNCVFQKEPLYIVQKDMTYFRNHFPELEAVMRNELRRHYAIEHEIGGVKIYRRIGT